CSHSPAPPDPHTLPLHDALPICAPYFSASAPFLADLFTREWGRLVDLNEYMLQGILGFLGIGTRLVRASALGLRLGKGNLLVDLCRELGATTYVSGAGGNCPQLDESA